MHLPIALHGFGARIKTADVGTIRTDARIMTYSKQAVILDSNL
jgi:hypothetical protein